jgi:hypothetical protein
MGIGRDGGTVGLGFGLVVLVFFGLAGIVGVGISSGGLTV